MKKNYTLYKKLLSVVAALMLCSTAFNALAQDVTVNICAGDTVSLYAKVPYSGNKPTYLWTVNGASALKNTDSVFTCTPVDGDKIVCLVTPHPSDLCLMPTNTPQYIIKEQCDKIYHNTCSTDSITFVAVEEDGLEVLTYQWFVNGVAVAPPGAYDSTYTHKPHFGTIDTVYCVIIVDDCAEPASTPKYIITLTPPTVIPLVPSILDVCSEEGLNFSVDYPNIIGWTRAPVSGISNSAGKGSGNSVSETLINTTKSNIPVEYLFTIGTDGCIIGKVTILVKPKVPVNARIVVRKH